MEEFVIICVWIFVFLFFALFEDTKKSKQDVTERNLNKTKKQYIEDLIKTKLITEVNLCTKKQISISLNNISTKEIKKFIGLEKPILEMNKRVMTLLATHLKTLHTKKIQTCYIDDYGIHIDNGWLTEKNYFIQQVILHDSILTKIQSKIEDYFEYLENQNKQLIEKTEDGLYEYWWQRYKIFRKWLTKLSSFPQYEESVHSVLQELGRTNIYAAFLSNINKTELKQHLDFNYHYNNQADWYTKLLYTEVTSVVNNDSEVFKKEKSNLFAVYSIFKHKNKIRFEYKKTIVSSDASNDTSIFVPYHLINFIPIKKGNDFFITSSYDFDPTKETYLNTLIDDALMFLDDNIVCSTNITNPFDYEKQIANILKDMGFNAYATKGSGDQGADVLATKNNVKFAIQCKMYSGPVGNKAVQEVNAARNFYNCDYAVVVTNATYTKSAHIAAKACNVILLHESQLDKLLDYITE